MTDAALDQDAELPEDGEAASAAGPRWKKPAILIGAPVAALLLIGGGVWLSGLGQKMFGGGDHAPAETHAPAGPKKAVFLDLPDLLVNLNGGGRKTSFLKMAISIE